jgi:ATP-dependent RNA helicase DOB1
MMVEEKMDPQAAKGILMGMADALHSSFHLGYNMLLNLLRFEGADPEFLIRRSFYQFQQDKMRPEWEGKIEGLELERKELVIEDEVRCHAFVTWAHGCVFRCQSISMGRWWIDTCQL